MEGPDSIECDSESRRFDEKAHLGQDCGYSLRIMGVELDILEIDLFIFSLEENLIYLH